MSELERIVAAVHACADHLLFVVVCFDGVLVDYEGDPASVRLSSDTAATLKAFVQRPDVALGIMSGRRVKALELHAPLGREVFYIGLHGLEIEGPAFAVTEHDAFAHCRDRIHDIAATVESSLSSVPGVRVEDKEAAIAVHTRQAGPGDAVWARLHLLSTAAALAERDELRILRGNHVLELVPNIRSPRATAIGRIRRHLEARERKPVLVLYIGEDLADDDAFEGLAGDDITAAVGARVRGAHHHLTSTADVRQLLERLTRDGASLLNSR